MRESQESTMSDREKAGSAEWRFLMNEYAFLADYLKFNYEERDRYVNTYVAVLAAIVALVGFAADKDSWTPVLLLSLLSAVLSYFVLLKVLYQRVVVTEYKNQLNVTRGRLCDLAACESATRRVLLPTTASICYLKTSGGDAAIHRVLEIVTGASASAAIYIAVWRVLPSSCFLAGASPTVAAVLIFAIVVAWLERKWKSVLTEKDKRQRDGANPKGGAGA